VQRNVDKMFDAFRSALDVGFLADFVNDPKHFVVNERLERFHRLNLGGVFGSTETVKDVDHIVGG